MLVKIKKSISVALSAFMMFTFTATSFAKSSKNPNGKRFGTYYIQYTLE